MIERKIVKKAKLLDEFMERSSASTINRDYRILRSKYSEIEPNATSKNDPLITQVFNGKMMSAIFKVTGSRNVIRLSECPTLTELSEAKVPFGKKSIEVYMSVMQQHGMIGKLI